MKSFNVRFIADGGRVDETQFDVETNVFYQNAEEVDVQYVMFQILDLWEQFRQENKFERVWILDVYEVPYISEESGESCGILQG